MWKPPLFPTELHQACLEIMRMFSISYQIDNDTDIIPFLLPDAKPDYKLLWLEYDPSRIMFARQWQFEFIPLGIFSHLIIRSFSSFSLFFFLLFLFPLSSFLPLFTSLSSFFYSFSPFIHLSPPLPSLPPDSSYLRIYIFGFSPSPSHCVPKYLYPPLYQHPSSFLLPFCKCPRKREGVPSLSLLLALSALFLILSSFPFSFSNTKDA